MTTFNSIIDIAHILKDILRKYVGDNAMGVMMCVSRDFAASIPLDETLDPYAVALETGDIMFCNAGLTGYGRTGQPRPPRRSQIVMAYYEGKVWFVQWCIDHGITLPSSLVCRMIEDACERELVTSWHSIPTCLLSKEASAQLLENWCSGAHRMGVKRSMLNYAIDSKMWWLVSAMTREYFSAQIMIDLVVADQLHVIREVVSAGRFNSQVASGVARLSWPNILREVISAGLPVDALLWSRVLMMDNPEMTRTLWCICSDIYGYGESEARLLLNCALRSGLSMVTDWLEALVIGFGGTPGDYLLGANELTVETYGASHPIEDYVVGEINRVISEEISADFLDDAHDYFLDDAPDDFPEESAYISEVSDDPFSIKYPSTMDDDYGDLDDWGNDAIYDDMMARDRYSLGTTSGSDSESESTD